MRIENSDIYGGSLILSRLARNSYPSIGNEIMYFVAFQEFDKYVRYISYGIARKAIIDEICHDVEAINSVFKHTSTPANIRKWITANFSYVYGLISSEEED